MEKSALQPAIQKLFDRYKGLHDGQPAQYIPELAKVDPNQFAITIVDCNGNCFSVGDANTAFTLQSTSKPFVYALALEQNGAEYVHTKVGVEPTGEVFNSIIELEEKQHRPFNPMINSGAIATAALIRGASPVDRLQCLRKFFQELTNQAAEINSDVFNSEKETAHRNRAIAHLMKHFSVMDSDIEETLDLYFQQCSINVTTLGLAAAAATLANKGVNPLTKKKIIDNKNIQRTLSLMFTCGMYDSAGEWAFNVGIPAKSGVSGALFTVVPGQFGVAVYSPRINSHGHSVRGQKVISDLANEFNLHIFG